MRNQNAVKIIMVTKKSGIEWVKNGCNCKKEANCKLTLSLIFTLKDAMPCQHLLHFSDWKFKMSLLYQWKISSVVRKIYHFTLVWLPIRWISKNFYIKTNIRKGLFKTSFVLTESLDNVFFWSKDIVINAIMSLYCPADYVFMDAQGGVE